MTDPKIPSAEEAFEEEAKVVLREGDYDFQIEKVLEQLKTINKNNSTATVLLKALPNQKILDELETQGYRVRFETCYDSTKQERFLTKLRITNPKFEPQGTNFMDNLEDHLKECAFSQGSFKVSDDAKKIFQSFFGNL